MSTQLNQKLEIFPWQQKQWQSVNAQIHAGRLPHALLLCGEPGLGKRDFAAVFSARLLCSSPTEELPCGNCRNCKLYKADNHPDLHFLRPEKAGAPIGVNQVRNLLEDFSTTARRGSWQIAIFQPAEALNLHAANALLKFLEEPGDSILLLLLSDRPLLLPATIRSRCQKLRFVRPPFEQGLDWLHENLKGVREAQSLLSLAAGLPLRAQAIHEKKALLKHRKRCTDLIDFCEGRLGSVELADRWGGKAAKKSLLWLQNWLLDVRRRQLSKDTSLLRYQEQEAEVLKYATCLSAQAVHQLWSENMEILDRFERTNPEANLALEESLFRLREAIEHSQLRVQRE